MHNRSTYPLALYLAMDAREREIRAAARERRVSRGQAAPLRRAVGQSIIRIGARVAGEPSLGLARSR